MAIRIHSRSVLYFDAVRRTGSIREAARKLNVAASAISRQIIKLEAECGAPLFDRLTDSFKLTAAGEVFASHVITVLQDTRRVEADLDALKGVRRGEITIACVEGAAFGILPGAMAAMRARYPGIGMRIQVMSIGHVAQAVASGDVDIGLTFSLSRNDSLRQVFHERIPMGVSMRPTHPLAREKFVTVPMCLPYPFILLNGTLSTNPVITPLLNRYRDRLIVAAQADSFELMRRLAIKLDALTIQARMGLDDEIASGEMVHVPLHAQTAITTEFGIYVRAGRFLSSTVDAFLVFLREELDRQASRSNGPAIPAGKPAKLAVAKSAAVKPAAKRRRRPVKK
jgi:DNA-binding transcriptional LysR family regulator